ncbi:MAG: protein kinase domain-containing protein, partial [Brasilonema sp.]
GMTWIDFRKGTTVYTPPIAKLLQSIISVIRKQPETIDGEDKYTGKNFITKGFFADVYEAKNKNLGHDVVIKQLHNESIKDKFKKTIKDAFTISHFSNFITIYDYCEPPNEQPYYVMQYVKGENLRKKLDREHPRKWPRDSTYSSWIEYVLDIVLKIGDALIEARKKVKLKYYFNIKPSNIIIDTDYEPFISAFNLCVNFEKKEIIKELEELKTETDLDEGKFKEELAYLVPEKFIDAYDMDNYEKTDQYMLGLLAYELLTGKTLPPIQDFETLKNDDCEKVFQKIAFPESLFKDYNISENYKVLIESIIPRMTALNPKDRYGSLGEVLEIIRIKNIFKDTTETINVVKRSYNNCINNPNFTHKNPNFTQSFFSKFYEKFMKHADVSKIFSEVKPSFWDNHHKLVEQTISLFFWYYEEKMIFKIEPTINPLEYIVKRHNDRDISEDLFIFFKNMLISTITDYDDKCKEESYKTLIQDAWEKVLEPGFDYIKSEYIKSKSQKRSQNSSDNIPITSTIAHSIT